MKFYFKINSFFKKLSNVLFFFKNKLNRSSEIKNFFFNSINEFYSKFIFFSTSYFNVIFSKIFFIKKKISNVVSNFAIKQFFNKKKFIKYFKIVFFIFFIIIFFFILCSLYIFYVISPEIIIWYPFTTAKQAIQYYSDVFIKSDSGLNSKESPLINAHAVRLSGITIENMKVLIGDTKIRGFLYYTFNEYYVDYYINRSTYWTSYNTKGFSKEEIFLIKKLAKKFIIEIFEKGKNSDNSFSFIKYIKSGKDFWKKK